MAGEYIEDLKISLLGMSNQQVEQKCNFLPIGMKNNELEVFLSKSMDKENAIKILQDPNLSMQLQREYE